jgi:acetyltransferase
MDGIFEPRRIAVIGASRSRKKVGGVVFRNLLEANVPVVPINPNAKFVCKKRAYPSVLAYKKHIDLAIVAVPAPIVPTVIEDCGKRGIRSVIIISSGFAETGKQGISLEARIISIAKRHNINILGPNCLGIINVNRNLNASFFKGMPKKGGIAFVSQSGALAVALLDYAISEGIGLSKFISLGNMMQIDFSDVLEYLEDDRETRCICLYIETIKDGRKFMRTIKHTKKPIIVIKAGKGEKGLKAASSHTGALASSAEVYSGAFRQSGIIETNAVYEMLEVALAMSADKRPKGKRVLIVTNAGGPGVLAADACEESGLDVVALPNDIKRQLDSFLPATWSHNNPVDVIGDAMSNRYRKVFNIIKGKNFYDIIFVILTPQAMTDVDNIAKAVVALDKKSKAPVYTCFMGGHRIANAKGLFRSRDIMNFDEPRRCARILSLATGS